jgi:hypothetical protein
VFAGEFAALELTVFAVFVPEFDVASPLQDVRRIENKKVVIKNKILKCIVMFIRVLVPKV